MWKNATFLLKTASKEVPSLCGTPFLQQVRTTYILKRRFPTQLHKKGGQPKKLRSRHYVYDLVKDTTTEKQPNIDVILTDFVEGYGNAGEKISVNSQFAYNNLLVPGLAVYASPENIEKYKDQIEALADKQTYSSANAALTLKTLSRMTLSVVMNKDHPWTLQPWHIKTSFRKCGYVVPEDAIALPEKSITGPNMDSEGKEFYVIVTINNTEKVNVRCRLHHWSTEIVDRIPYVDKFWENPTEPIYSEFTDVLQTIPPKITKLKD
ncbi:39S ribosomal protein L9, mitochondrial [Sitophilus oryzae]|uniref:Large ribosomal subunit protein bL9m n=1 Tax=Sitophilus oryzae TaxID=7048 RepID=A0A6J2YA10_SITOR|nr:39S ribosomal protein L9, mitochondrial [Sitophilus oryzae]